MCHFHSSRFVRAHCSVGLGVRLLQHCAVLSAGHTFSLETHRRGIWALSWFIFTPVLFSLLFLDSRLDIGPSIFLFPVFLSCMVLQPTSRPGLWLSSVYTEGTMSLGYVGRGKSRPWGSPLANTYSYHLHPLYPKHTPAQDGPRLRSSGSF